MKKIDVLYTVDKNYFKHMLVSLYSLLESNQDLDVIVHIIYDGLSLEDFRKIDDVINRFERSSVYCYDYSKIAKEINEFNIPNWRNSRIPNARIFFSYILPLSRKLLYLDSDTMVVDSLKGLDKYDGTICMAKDFMPKTHMKHLDSSLKNYYNSGVLWINEGKWFDNNCDEKIATALVQDIDLIYPDQDLINVALKDDIETLPPEYDLFPLEAYLSIPALFHYYRLNHIDRYSKEEMKHAKKNPIILHSTPFFGYRTWDLNDIHPFNAYYDEYCLKLFEQIIKEENEEIKNSLSFKLYQHLYMIVPNNIKSTVKKLIKK